MVIDHLSNYPGAAQSGCPKCRGRLVAEEDGPYCLCCGWRPTISSVQPERREARRAKRARHQRSEAEMVFEAWTLAHGPLENLTIADAVRVLATRDAAP